MALPEYLKPMIGFAMWHFARGADYKEVQERMHKRFGGPEISEDKYITAVEFALVNMRLTDILNAQIDIRCDGKGHNKCSHPNRSGKLSSVDLLSQLAKLLASE